DDGFPLLPQRIISDLESALKPDDLVISDVGAHKLWVAKRFRAHLPNTVIISNGFAAMGIGLPGAIAAKLAQPERRVVAVTGDGRLTSMRLTRHFLERIEAYDRRGPRLNAVLEVNPEALEIAEALDRERASTGSRGPLHGIPVLLKDNIATADRLHTSAGSLA